MPGHAAQLAQRVLLLMRLSLVLSGAVEALRTGVTSDVREVSQLSISHPWRVIEPKRLQATPSVAVAVHRCMWRHVSGRIDARPVSSIAHQRLVLILVDGAGLQMITTSALLMLLLMMLLKMFRVGRHSLRILVRTDVAQRRELEGVALLLIELRLALRASSQVPIVR